MSEGAGWFSSSGKWLREVTGYATEADATTNNEQQLRLLQDQYEKDLRLSEQYRLNAIRLGNTGNRIAARNALAHQKVMRVSFCSIPSNKAEQEAEANANRTAGKIATLQGVSSNLRSMQSNVEMARSIEISNGVSARMAGKINVDRVEGIMDNAREYKDMHHDISNVLAGDSYLDPVDPDEADAELDALLGKAKADPLHPVNAPGTAADPRATMETPAQKAAREDEVLRREKAANDILDRMPAAPVKDHRKPLPGAIKTKGPK